MVDKTDSTLIKENNKSPNQFTKRNLISHQLLFDDENLNQLEETLKTIVTQNKFIDDEDTLEDCEEHEINLEVSPSDEDVTSSSE